MSTIYPTLIKIAFKYLLPIAISVLSDRLIPKAGLTINKQRKRLTSKHLSNLLFLKSLDDSLWYKTKRLILFKYSFN